MSLYHETNVILLAVLNDVPLHDNCCELARGEIAIPALNQYVAQTWLRLTVAAYAASRKSGDPVPTSAVFLRAAAEVSAYYHRLVREG